MSISGRGREDCIKAYRFTNNNPDIAFEVLLSGQPIPDKPLGQGPEGDEADGGYGDEDGQGLPDAGGLGNLNLDPETMQAIQALVNNPSFPMIRQRMI